MLTLHAHIVSALTVLVVEEVVERVEEEVEEELREKYPKQLKVLTETLVKFSHKIPYDDK